MTSGVIQDHPLRYLTSAVLTPAQITSNQDNYAPTNGATNMTWRISSDASRNLTGISVGQVAGRLLLLSNIGSENIVLKHDVTSTAANRFYLPGGTDLTLGQYDSVLLEYDGTLSRWVVISSTLAGSGGGGAPTTADYVVGTANGSLSAELVLGSAVIMSGALGSRPAASLAGLLYFATDVNGGALYRDTGATWVQVAYHRQFKETILIGNGNKTTTSTSFVAIDTTNLPYLTIDAAVGDVIECVLCCQAYNSGTGYEMFDVEVDRPTSGDTRIYADTDSGGWLAGGANTRFGVTLVARYVVGEAGTHGFRPMWRVTAGTGTLANATSGADDTAIVFSVCNLGPVAA